MNKKSNIAKSICRLQKYSISTSLLLPNDKDKHAVERVGNNNQTHIPDPGQINRAH